MRACYLLVLIYISGPDVQDFEVDIYNLDLKGIDGGRLGKGIVAGRSSKTAMVEGGKLVPVMHISNKEQELEGGRRYRTRYLCCDQALGSLKSPSVGSRMDAS